MYNALTPQPCVSVEETSCEPSGVHPVRHNGQIVRAGFDVAAYTGALFASLLVGFRLEVHSSTESDDLMYIQIGPRRYDHVSLVSDELDAWILFSILCR